MNTKRLLSTSVALVMAGAGTVLATGPAQAAPIYDCLYTTNTGINLFRSPTSTTADYFVGAGKTLVDLGCSGLRTGRSYTDCRNDNRWVPVDSVAGAPNKHGFAAFGCVDGPRRVLR
ncbi:hypothetical protein [Kribbella sp. CA-293567]|uniref:hypothetical protein n=1 Tax=Kribbella sp. CA-293567 TaxID=3002436 RepID=UPI0022DD9180|nr:hypothetical protein [Kribbella sp. CA-293567]WBQ04482.1 hypothetical protein OX958_31530 [Kribbella sp. CA-293567]